jgi:hypothetical protein
LFSEEDREADIDDFEMVDAVFLCEHNVGKFQIAMDDVIIVEMLDSVEELLDDDVRLECGHRTSARLKFLPESASFKEFCDEEVKL